jgi:hypothetical protein
LNFINEDAVLALTLFGRNGLSETNGRWGDLVKQLKLAGVKVWDPTSGLSPSHWLCVDYDSRTTKELFSLVPKRNRWLVCVEPATVNPSQYSKRIRSHFETVSVSSKASAHSSSSSVWQGGHIWIPSDVEKVKAGGRRIIAAGLINESKFSFVNGSLYSLRHRLIKRLSKAKVDLRVAGANWSRGYLWFVAKQAHAALIAFNSGRLPDFSHFSLPLRHGLRAKMVGRVADSIGFLSRHKVAVVIENEATYVSEKLFNALLAGCVCVYVGPPMNPSDFPSGFLIQSPPELDKIQESVVKALLDADPPKREEIERWIIESEAAKSWSVHLRNKDLVVSVLNWLARQD